MPEEEEEKHSDVCPRGVALYLSYGTHIQLAVFPSRVSLPGG